MKILLELLLDFFKSFKLKKDQLINILIVIMFLEGAIITISILHISNLNHEIEKWKNYLYEEKEIAKQRIILLNEQIEYLEHEKLTIETRTKESIKYKIIDDSL